MSTTRSRKAHAIEASSPSQGYQYFYVSGSKFFDQQGVTELVLMKVCNQFVK